MTEIEESIIQLKKMKQIATVRLSYFESKTVFRKIFIPLLSSFLVVLISFLASEIKIQSLCLVFVFSILYYVAVEFIKFLQLLHKVKESADEKEVKALQRIGDLLENLNENQKKIDDYLNAVQVGSESIKKSLNQLSELENVFLEKVYVSFGGVDLDGDKNVRKIKVNEKVVYSISVENNEDRMAKDVEAGFRFPSDLVVDNTGPDSIFKNPKDGEQIARYKVDRIHGDTSRLLESLSITPIKKGRFDVRVFLKAENIKAKSTVLKFEVI